MKIIKAAYDFTKGEVAKAVSKVNAPVLVIQGKKDRIVHPRSAQYIYDHIAGNKKELIWVEDGEHSLATGREKETIMEGGAKKKFGLFMIHGFSGSNEEFNDLEEFFKNKGVAVKAPMLLGHGTTPEDMIARSPADWLRQIEIELDEFFKQADNIFLGGISFGGNLAIQIAGKNKHIRGL